jgi:hypothetical protein
MAMMRMNQEYFILPSKKMSNSRLQADRSQSVAYRVPVLAAPLKLLLD